jgi:hypothetical protein
MAKGSRTKSFAVVFFCGTFAVVYLLLAWRASYLDTQVGEGEKRIAQAQFELLQARRELSLLLSPAAAATLTSQTAQGNAAVPQDTIACPQLPPQEPSPLLGLAGLEVAQAPPGPQRLARTPTLP